MEFLLLCIAPVQRVIASIVFILFSYLKVVGRRLVDLPHCATIAGLLELFLCASIHHE